LLRKGGAPGTISLFNNSDNGVKHSSDLKFHGGIDGIQMAQDGTAGGGFVLYDHSHLELESVEIEIRRRGFSSERSDYRAVYNFPIIRNESDWNGFGGTFPNVPSYSH
jgi:hypothetical protein